MKAINNFLIIMILLVACSETTTPVEFLYHNPELDALTYSDHQVSLGVLSLSWLDSVYSIHNTGGDNYLESRVDTIFYGPANKIAFLAVSKRENKFASDENNEGVDFTGDCFIATAEQGVFRLLSRLKYRVTSPYGYDDALVTLRQMYFREMQYLDDIHNLNDKRFWDCAFWNGVTD